MKPGARLFLWAFGLLSLFGSCTATFAQSSRSPEAHDVPAYADPARFIGKPALRWIIPPRYWTNTRDPVWLGGLERSLTVIEFFRIGCSHCQDAAPSREALYRKYRRRGLKMVGFQSPGSGNAKERSWTEVKRTVHQWGLTYPIAFDKDGQFFGQYGLGIYPTLMVLDRKGIVRFYQTGFPEDKARGLDKFVANLLQPQPQSR